MEDNLYHPHLGLFNINFTF